MTVGQRAVYNFTVVDEDTFTVEVVVTKALEALAEACGP